ncbi:putative phosphatase regulatory subunit-domain-containing protein [Xylaria bambusicola]|uniref:putative phosphatase regulatory subunit-domain-containing protein n=1 Tax=Xylaria bambusicola TaxID=326684 RepID=UPI0020084482|nr:putative phosphatase regulatory subunit-domain-containing protein [Xylaria bambusicola]KAI0527965.1 putative phosphatase regulatory subunit-domain-containing protein [Xylaria bambusicola]
MPYTPPTHCSPPTSAQISPEASRRSSFNQSTTAQSRPALPRSSSYLTRHRRSISASATPISALNHGSTPDITPPGTSDNLKEMVANHSSNVRQSPPPVTDAKVMPPGAIISPPESSSEDEGVPDLEVESKEREREIESIKELKEAISAIPQCRVGSPVLCPPSYPLFPSQIDQVIETPPKPDVDTIALTPRRAKSHSRSNTDTDLYLSKMTDVTSSGSEENSEEDLALKPPMVRKKSGELVRPALRPAHLRRPSSMPGTPTFSKAVHFDSHLEHVRHFLQVDRPLAVSTDTSPADNYDSDTEYPFKSGEKRVVQVPSFEWEIVMHNPPAQTPIRKGLPVRLERVWMSPDQKSLIGFVSVANLAFQKTVVCRFTFDYWKTTSEVGAEYHHDIRPGEKEAGYDRFQFSIKLSDIADLQAKTLFFCVRYNVNGLEYWDNNNSVNFQVDFRKRFPTQNGRKGSQGVSSRPSLPRSNRRTNPSTITRPKSMPVGPSDDFGLSSTTADNRPIHEFLGESEPPSLRLKSSKSTASLPSDNLPGRLSTPSGVAFANRYDFGASLSAAKQAQRSPNSSPRQNDVLYMKAHQRNTISSPTPADTSRPQIRVSQPTSFTTQQQNGPSIYSAPFTSSPGPASPSSASITSASYEEILNKYCFFNGTKQTSPPMKDGTLQTARYDGTYDYSINSSENNPSLSGRNASNVVSNGPVPDRDQFHSIQHMSDRSPFVSDTHTAKAISC